MYKDRYKQLVRLSVTQPPTPILNMLLGGGRGGGSGTGSGIARDDPMLAWASLHQAAGLREVD